MSQWENMHIERVGGSKLIEDYISQDEILKKFIVDFPSLNAITNVAKSHGFDKVKRGILHKSIVDQYSASSVDVPNFWSEVLEENTFTITTGHQLNLFGGPKYLVYKIVSVLKQVEQLNSSQEEFNFIPVFWMASEDHDFEEINLVKLFGESISIENDHSGPVGRIGASNLNKPFEELQKVLGTSKEASELIQMFEEALKQENFADFTRKWVNDLFDGKIVIIDGDDKSLKEMFRPAVQRELEEQITEKMVTRTNEKLDVLGYHTQVTHREINLFQIEDGIRERIVSNSQGLKLSADSISPNALLRPVYQEMILPNAAYVGGPGELAYWFQLKGLFEELGVSFPILVLRDSFLFVREKDLDQLGEFNVSLSDLQQDMEDLKKYYISTNDLKLINFETELEALDQVYGNIYKKIGGMHRDYHQMIEAEKTRMKKFIKKMELRSMRDAKFKEDINIKRLLQIRERYFPEGVLIERSSSFMEEYLLLGKEQYLNLLMSASNTSDSRIKVITVKK